MYSPNKTQQPISQIRSRTVVTSLYCFSDNFIWRKNLQSHR